MGFSLNSIISTLWVRSIVCSTIDLSSRQMISPFLLMGCLEMHWPRALISWIHSSTLSSGSIIEAFYHCCVVFSLGSLSLKLHFSLAPFSNSLCVHTKFSCCGFLAITFCLSNGFEFCAYTVAVSFLSFSTCFTTLHTQMIIFLNRSTGTVLW